MDILRISDIRLNKRTQIILDQVSFAVGQGDMTGVLGPSGAGKSSLFRLINRLHTPAGGTIEYMGKDIREYDPRELRRDIGYVLQKPYLFGELVRENLEYPFRLLKQPPDAAGIGRYLERVNLPVEVLNKKNSDLSGGEQQRVALVRSLLIQPKVLLLDEVTASLDEENTRLIEQLILQEKEEKRLTVLFITHNVEQARRLASKVLYLAQGRVEFYGGKAEFFQWKGEEPDE